MRVAFALHQMHRRTGLIAALLAMPPSGARGLDTGRTASEIIRDFTQDDGVVSFYEACVRENGPFRTWRIEEKTWFSRLLPDLMAAEEARMKQHHPDLPVSVPFADSILTWRFGRVEPGMISQNEALRKAKDMLLSDYGSESEEDQVSVSLYTGHRAMETFEEPYYVFRLYVKGQKHAEVWVNARTGALPRREGMEVEREAKRQFALRAGKRQRADEKGAEDRTQPEQVSVFFDGHAWHAVIRMADAWQDMVLDDTDLEIVEIKDRQMGERE